MLTASGLALGAAAAAAAPGQPGTSQPAAARAVRAPAAGQAACNANASSLRPSGPPQVTSGSFMAKIRARGYLIAGVDQSTYHFGFLNPLTNQIEGFDIDVIRAVAKAIFGSSDPSRIHYKAISDAQRIPDITSGTVDIVAHTMTITCDRLKSVDFSAVYFEAHQKVLVLKNSTATSLASLHGQKVCATSGSDSVTKIDAAKATAVQVPYWTDCLVLLQQGSVAAVSTDDSILDGLAAQDPYTKLIGGPAHRRALRPGDLQAAPGVRPLRQRGPPAVRIGRPVEGQLPALARPPATAAASSSTRADAMTSQTGARTRGARWR